MSKVKKIDPDNPPTAPGDWTGAAVVSPHRARTGARPGGLIFHLFRASTNPALFAVTDRNDRSVLPNCPGGGEWRLFKVVPETGQPRVGFSEVAAKADIRKKGYHLVEVRVDTSETISRRRPAAASARRRAGPR